MFNLFKKQEPIKQEAPVAVMERPMKEIIEEIHETFFTEVDRLLDQAKVANSLHTDKQAVIDKAKRLTDLGFSSTKEAIEAKEETIRLGKLELENNNKKELIEAINYFSFKYPHMKFITEDSVKKICAKYNLIYGPVTLYTGKVPEKNLKEMEGNGAKIEDKYFLSRTIASFHGVISMKPATYKEYEEYRNPPKGHYHRFHSDYHDDVIMLPLEIAAPAKDFDLKRMEVKDFKINPLVEILDPVVLEPVQYKRSKYYLIRTAWGLEASDEDVVNHKMN